MGRFYWVRFKDHCEEEPDYYEEPNIIGFWQSGFCGDGYPIICSVVYGEDKREVERIIDRVTKGEYQDMTASPYESKEEVIKRHSQVPGGNRFLANEGMMDRLNKVGNYSYRVNYRS